MTRWIRFEQGGKTGFGTLEGDTIAVHEGDLFAGAKPTGKSVKLSEVEVRTPCDPSKMICLWNNFHQLAAKNDFTRPKEPLWFLKAPNAYWPGTVTWVEDSGPPRRVELLQDREHHEMVELAARARGLETRPAAPAG